jgi:hypothetical protein
MVGPGNQFTSLISELFVLKLMMVRFLNAFNIAVRRFNQYWQNFQGQFCYRRRN